MAKELITISISGPSKSGTTSVGILVKQTCEDQGFDTKIEDRDTTDLDIARRETHLDEILHKLRQNEIRILIKS